MSYECARGDGGCGKRFGSLSSFDRGFDRRSGRCLTADELRAIGLVPNDAGVWVRGDHPGRPRQGSLFRKAKRVLRGQALGRRDDPPGPSSQGTRERPSRDEQGRLFSPKEGESGK